MSMIWESASLPDVVRTGKTVAGAGLTLSVDADGNAVLSASTSAINVKDGAAGAETATSILQFPVGSVTYDGSGKTTVTFPGGGATALSGLSDVTLTSVANLDVLAHNGTAWVDTMLSVSHIQSGTFGVARGGTGRADLNSGEILVGAGTGAVTYLAPGASAGYVVRSTGAAWAVAQLSFSDLGGTIATGQVSGSYTGITAVGTIAAGTWQGTPVAAAYLGAHAASHASGGSDPITPASIGAAGTGHIHDLSTDANLTNVLPMTKGGTGATYGAVNPATEQVIILQGGAFSYLEASGSGTRILQASAGGVVSWVSPGTITAQTFAGLTDTTFTSLTDRDLAMWDSTLGYWRNVAQGDLDIALAPHTHSNISVLAGTGLTGGGTLGASVTLNVVSHGGAAGSVGTLTVTADSVGVNLGTTSTTAAAGNHTHTGVYSPVGHTHPASDVTAGTFGAGTYIFPSTLEVVGSLFIISGGTAGFIDLQSYGSRTLRINNLGNTVQIASPLQVSGAATDLTAGPLRIYSSSTFRGGLGVSSWAWGDAANNLALMAPASHELQLGAGATKALVIGTDGNNYVQTGLAVRGAPAAPFYFAVGDGTADVRAEFRPNTAYAVSFARSTGGRYYIGATSAAAPALVFSNHVGTTRMTLSDAGNLNVGSSTPKAWGTGYFSIEIGTAAAIMAGNSAGPMYLLSNVWWSGSNYTRINAAAIAGAYLSAGDFGIYNAPTGTAGAAVTMTTRLLVFNNGNVIIGGTSDAGYKLNVVGTVYASGIVTAAAGLITTDIDASGDITYDGDLIDGVYGHDVAHIIVRTAAQGYDGTIAARVGTIQFVSDT